MQVWFLVLKLYERTNKGDCYRERARERETERGERDGNDSKTDSEKQRARAGVYIKEEGVSSPWGSGLGGGGGSRELLL